MVDEERAGADHSVPGAQDGQMGLGFLAAVLDGREHPGVEASEPGERLRIGPVCLPRVAVDQREHARVRDDALVPQLVEQPADPRRVGTRLDHYALPLGAPEDGPQRRQRGADTPLGFRFVPRGERDVGAVAVAHVQASG